MRKFFLLLSIHLIATCLWAQPYQWVRQLKVHEASISFMSVDEDTQLLLSGDESGKVILWSLEFLAPIQQIHVQEGLITHIDVDTEHGWLLISSYDGSIVLWDYFTSREIKRFENPGIGAYGDLNGNEPTFGVFISGTNDIAFGGYNASVYKADIATGRTTLLYRDRIGGITSGFWKKEERSLYFSTLQTVYKIAWPSGQVTRFAEGEQPLCEIYPRPEGQALLNWTYDGQVQFWKAGNLQRSIKASPNEGTSAIAYSTTHQLLITGNVGTDVWVWNSEEEVRIQKLDRHLFPVRCMAIVQEDASLFTADMTGTIHHWKYPVGLSNPSLNANTDVVANTEANANTSGNATTNIGANANINPNINPNTNANENENTVQIPPISTVRPDTNTVINIQETISTTDDFAHISIWDHDQMDHDTISLKVNDKWLITNFPLTKNKKRFSIPLRQGVNLLTLYAHNEGLIPPNTAGVHFDVNGEESFVRIYSDRNTSGTIKIVRESD
ncbi:MAG: hypothetical protein AAF985_13925 [Bacteroidota bacterium]